MPFSDDGSWFSSGCRDCDSLTSGRCRLHTVSTYTIGTIIPVRPLDAPPNSLPPLVPVRPFFTVPAPCLPLDQFLYWPKP